MKRYSIKMRVFWTMDEMVKYFDTEEEMNQYWDSIKDIHLWTKIRLVDGEPYTEYKKKEFIKAATKETVKESKKFTGDGDFIMRLECDGLPAANIPFRKKVLTDPIAFKERCDKIYGELYEIWFNGARVTYKGLVY